MSVWGLNLSQAEHDARHPGKRCQTCPIEREAVARLQRRRDEWAKRERWRMRWLPWIVGAVLIGSWLLGAYVLGPSQ